MYQVEGYVFENKELADKAAIEVEGIRYIKERTSLDDPDMVMNLYQQMLDEDVFETPVGIGFLTELQNYLETVPYIKSEDIQPIPIKLSSIEQEEIKKENKKEEKKPREKKEHEKRVYTEEPADKIVQKYRLRFHVSLFFAIVFAATIVGMFVITYQTGNNVNIINYENEIINKYENWENELQERENKIQEKEKQLGIESAE